MAFLPVVLIVQALPISVGGLGVREGLFVFFFTKLGGDRCRSHFAGAAAGGHGAGVAACRGWLRWCLTGTGAGAAVKLGNCRNCRLALLVVLLLPPNLPLSSSSPMVMVAGQAVVEAEPLTPAKQP